MNRLDGRSPRRRSPANESSTFAVVRAAVLIWLSGWLPSSDPEVQARHRARAPAAVLASRSHWFAVRAGSLSDGWLSRLLSPAEVPRRVSSSPWPKSVSQLG